MNLEPILECYRNLTDFLIVERSRIFPLGSVVWVDDERRTGRGIVESFPDNPSEIDIRFEDGKPLRYELDEVNPEDRVKNYPPWIQREMRKRRGKHAWKKVVA